MRASRTLNNFLATLTILPFLPLTSMAAPPPGKGGGGNDPPPVVTPVIYNLSTIAVDGLDGVFDSNDFGLAICNLTPASGNSFAIVNLHTADLTYIEDVLAGPTIWTELPEGVDWVDVVAIKLNNHGAITVTAHPVIDGQYQYPIAYLLHPVLETTPEGAEAVRYQPEDLGVAAMYFLNDLNWLMGQDLTGYFIRKADGTRVYLDTIGLPFSVGASHDLSNLGLYYGETLNTQTQQWKRYTFDAAINSVTYLDDEIYSKDWPGTTLNDHGVVAGEYFYYYQYKDRGKTLTGIRRVPAVIDPVGGLQVFNDPNNGEVQNRVVYINHQRRDGQSTLLAYTPRAQAGGSVWTADRDLWLKLPNENGFHIFDAMDEGSKAVWSGLSIDYDHVQLLTPRAADLTVDNDAAPTISGISLNGTARHIWVCQPAP